jgi:uncharacterized membrane protein YbhN (UPF0104 family)
MRILLFKALRAVATSKRFLLLSLAVAGGFALLLGRQEGLARELGQSLTGFGPLVLATALALVVAQVGLQSLRFWAVVPSETPLTVVEAAHIFTVGDSANIVAPARGGEVLKMILMKRAWNGYGTSLSTASGVVLADRTVDAVSLLLLCVLSGSLGIAVSEVSHPGMSPAHTGAWVIMAVVATAAAVAFLPGAWRARLKDFTRQVRTGLSTLERPRCLLSVGIGVAAWGVELTALHVLCAGLGFAPSPARLVLALVLLNLGTSVPITFASLGVYEAALAYGLRQAGLSLPSAIAVAAAHHVIELLALGLCTAALSLPIHVFRTRYAQLRPGGP